ncbi:MAG: hypothetical protein KF880_01125 [Ferruginibacter sp.]|nr:hypothetical protein [Ferruginibacter sp.]
MSWLKRYKRNQIAAAIVWMLAGCGTIVLLAAAVKKNNNRLCYGVEVHITGASKHLFINEQDVKKILNDYSEVKPDGGPVQSIDLRKIEKIIERDVWVKNAELYVDINGILQVRVDEREPVARIFTVSNNSYYIDSSLKMLPLSEKVAARVPVFTGFPAETAILNDREKKLLKEVYLLADAISNDPFLNALTEQVNIQRGKFEIIPKIGDQIILLGDSEEYEQKLENLKLFYQKVMTKTSWNRYSEINLQFKNQVVAKWRSKEEVIADSLRTMQLMKLIADYTEKMAGDTVFNVAGGKEQPDDISIILQSVQRDEEPAMTEPVTTTPPLVGSGFTTIPGAVKPAPVKVPTVAPKASIPVKPVQKQTKQTIHHKKNQSKPVVKPRSTETQKPKAVMQRANSKPDNDY